MYWPFEWDGSKNFSIPFYEGDVEKLETTSLIVKRRCVGLLNRLFRNSFLVPSSIKSLPGGILCFIYVYRTRLLMVEICEDGYTSLIVTEGEDQRVIHKESMVGADLEQAMKILANGLRS